MNPEPVTLDEATAAKLAGANGAAIPLHSPAGTLVGYCISTERLAEAERDHRAIYDEMHRHWDSEAIRKLEDSHRRDPRPNVPHEAILRWLEAQ